MTRTSCIACLMVALWISPLVGQTVRGTVVDSSTSQPVPDATIELVAADNQVVARQSSGKDGRFRLRAPGAGTYSVRTGRVGYQAVGSSSLAVDARSDTSIVVRLAASPVELEPVVVATEANTYLETSGFFQRKAAGVGTFLDPPAVEKLATKAKVLGDILQHIPGVRMVLVPGSGGVRVPQLRTCRSVGTRLIPHPLAGRVAPDPNAIPQDSIAQDLSQYPTIYMDGMAVSRDMLGTLLPDQVLAAEVYMGPAEIPLQYGGTNAPCGVVLIWTKH